MSGLNHSADSCEAWFVENPALVSPAEIIEEPIPASQSVIDATKHKWKYLSTTDTTNKANTGEKIKKNSTIPVRSSVVHNK